MDSAESMAACIRKCFDKDKREKTILGIVAIATDPTIDPRIRVQAFDVLTRHGWPEEKTGAVGLRISGKGAQVLVQHIHQPIGLATTPNGVDPSMYTGVKVGEARQIDVGTARHIIESPAETPAGSEIPDPLAVGKNGRHRPS